MSQPGKENNQQRVTNQPSDYPNHRTPPVSVITPLNSVTSLKDVNTTKPTTKTTTVTKDE